MDTKEKFSFEGIDGTMKVYEDRVEIKPKGAIGFLSNQGNETFLIKNITSVEVRECSFIKGGHIQLSVHGTNEKRNNISFGGFGDRKSMNENAMKIKEYLIEQMQNPISSQPTVSSSSDELLKLSKLKDEGILSDEEFSLAKKKILGI